MRAELAGDTDAGAEVFSYLERHGISREEAVIPRNRREDLGGDQQRLVLASFPDEAAADKAAASLKSWEKSGDDLKVDGIGVLVADENGMVEEHKLGRTAGKKGMGIGVALGLVAAIPTAGLSLVAGAVGGAVGGGIIGHFFHKGLALSDEQAAHIAEELDAGGAIVGALTWDFQTKVVADKLVELGGTARSIDVAPVAA